MKGASNYISKTVHTDAKLATLDDIRQVVPSLLPGWSSSKVSVEVVTGGITNSIFKAKCQNGAPPVVLVRIFGNGDVFTPAQREMENILFEQLGEAGIAPGLLAVFGNGRVEQFLDARTIELREMVDNDIIDGVAKSMSKLHAFDPRGVGVAREPGMWKDMQRWADEVDRLVEKGLLSMPGSIAVDDCIEELKKVRAELDTLQCPIVFCHNDLLCGNILVNEDREVALVDFEYSSFNYRGFDIGNFFCEAMGGTTDGIVDESRYPSKGVRYRFCYEYLRGASDSTNVEVEALVEEAERFGRAAHLYWGLWALVQSVCSTVNFPYLIFAEQRLRIFFKTR